MPVLVKGKKCPHCDGDAPKSECICGSMNKALFSNAWAFLKQDDDPLGRALAAASGPRETPPTLQLPGMVNTADEPTRNDVDMASGGSSAPNPFIPDSIKYPPSPRNQAELEEMVAHDMNEVKQGRLPYSTLYQLPEDVVERVHLKQRGVIPGGFPFDDPLEPPEPDNSVSEGPDWRDDR